MKTAKSLLTICSLVIFFVFYTPLIALAEDLSAIRNIDEGELYDDPALQQEYVKAWIKHTFPETYPTMIEIARCEAQLQHWDADGNLLPHNTGASSAAGVFQVLLKLHGADIEARDLDMENIEDYMQFVQYLHDRNGNPFSDWAASQSCWDGRQYASNRR